MIIIYFYSIGPCAEHLGQEIVAAAAFRRGEQFLGRTFFDDKIRPTLPTNGPGKKSWSIAPPYMP